LIRRLGLRDNEELRKCLRGTLPQQPNNALNAKGGTYLWISPAASNPG